MRSLLTSVVVTLALTLCSVCARAEQVRALPTKVEAVLLIRTALVRLNDANQTANYHILRDLSAPAFRDRFSIEDLQKLFSGFREKNINFALALKQDPLIRSAHYMKIQDLMRFKGQVAIGNVTGNFDMTFQFSGGDWKLYGLDLQFERAARAGNA